MELLRRARPRFSEFEFSRARAELSDGPGRAGSDFLEDHYVE
jgi:hypothetical protein